MAAILSPLLTETALAERPAITPMLRTAEPAVGIETATVPDRADGAAVGEAAARRAALARLRRGRAGTIATSARGILSPGQTAVARRSLLGG